MTTTTKITKDMTIDEILTAFPSKAQKLAQVLTQAGLQCVGCHAATYETLEVGMLGHGYTKEALENVLVKLNKVLEEKQDLSTINLTPRAAKKYLEILAEEGKEGWGMRFSEEMAGCSGFEYVLDYSEKANADDEIFVCHGIEIHVKKGLVSRLMGSEIDYVDGLSNAGFKVTNPNVRSSCGCGTSHGY